VCDNSFEFKMMAKITVWISCSGHAAPTGPICKGLVVPIAPHKLASVTACL